MNIQRVERDLKRRIALVGDANLVGVGCHGDAVNGDIERAGDNVATLVVGVVAADLGTARRVHVEHLAVADGAKLLLKQLGERGECLFVGGGHGSPFLGAPAIEPVALAQMSQRTENNYYGKPCGLMDQAAVCLGGLAYMNFEDQAQPKTQKLELNFEDHGYALVLVKVGADHVAATDDYAAVPREMQDVAAEFGKARLCEVDVADFDAKLPELRAKLGDRACLRAVHYWYENGLVDKRWAALNAGDIDQFLVLTRESGASSAMYLQNVVAKLGSEQPSMYALALAEHVLDGRGAVRIHGGGFGGTIQAFVPLDLVDTFIAKMNSWLGEGSARHYAISDKGAYAAWL